VTQVAVAFVLLVGTGLLLASFRQVLAVDPGFDPKQLLTASLRLPAERYAGDPELVAFTDEALRRVRAIPGVTRAGLTSAIPLGGDHSDSVIFAEGYRTRPGESVISPTRIEVSDGYLETMRIPLRRGRYFEARDRADSPRVVVVDDPRTSILAEPGPGRPPNVPTQQQGGTARPDTHDHLADGRRRRR
jgi:putative ABC transport system permease protein